MEDNITLYSRVQRFKFNHLLSYVYETQIIESSFRMCKIMPRMRYICSVRFCFQGHDELDDISEEHTQRSSELSKTRNYTRMHPQAIIAARGPLDYFANLATVGLIHYKAIQLLEGNTLN